MNFFKTNFVILLFLFFFTPFQIIQADTIDYYHVDVKLFENNTAEVTETIHYNFGDSNKHGIYRKIPESFKAASNLFPIDIKIEGVTDENGKSYKYSNQSSGDINLKIGDQNQYADPKEIYIIRYLVKNPIGFFENNDEFYWNLTGNDWNVSSISNVSAKVEFPRKIEENIEYYDYCGLVNSNLSCGYFEVNDSTINFKSDKVFLPGEGVTLDLEFNKGIISQPTKLDNLMSFIWKYLPIWTALILAILIFRKFFKVQVETMKLYKRFKSSHPEMVQYTPEKFSVIEASFFHDGKSISAKDISGFIVWCAIERYIKIIEENGDYYFDKLERFNKMEDGPEKDFIDHLSEIKIENKGGVSRVVARSQNSEDNLLISTIKSTLITQKMEPITASLFNLYVSKIIKNGYLHSETVQKIEKKLEKNSKLSKKLQLTNFFDYINVKKNGLIFVLLFASLNPGIFLIFLAAILGFGPMVGLIPSFIAIFLAIFILFFVEAIPNYTEKGMEASWFIKGLFKYIKMSEKERIRVANNPEKTPVLFEKLLPYAMVFGLEEKWMKEFEGIYQITDLSWISSESSDGLNLFSLSNFSKSIDKSLGKSMVSKSSLSGGFSGGGGSSGGGGGGGGGGSW